MLYRSTDCLRRGGAPVQNRAHNASLHARDKIAPSKSGIKHLIVRVKSGSSDQEAALADVLKEAVVGAVDKMEPTHIAIVLVVLVLTWGGSSVMRTWLNNRMQAKIAEANAASNAASNTRSLETINKAFETIQTLAVDGQHTALLRRAQSAVPVISGLRDEADEARQSLVKHASQNDACINGVEIPSDVGRKDTTESRVSASDERKDGACRIRKVDTTAPDGFRVYVENIQTQEAFSANVQEVMSSLEDRELIKEAEWSKLPVQLQVNARVKKGEVIEATILRAAKFEQPDSQADD